MPALVGIPGHLGKGFFGREGWSLETPNQRQNGVYLVEGFESQKQQKVEKVHRNR
jgi:hypothetical protein